MRWSRLHAIETSSRPREVARVRVLGEVRTLLLRVGHVREVLASIRAHRLGRERVVRVRPQLGARACARVDEGVWVAQLAWLANTRVLGARVGMMAWPHTEEARLEGVELPLRNVRREHLAQATLERVLDGDVGRCSERCDRAVDGEPVLHARTPDLWIKV